MMKIRRSHERGHADHGWLDTYHTFSFASYFDPDHVQFGPLRVLNQDRVAPGRGFGTHGHENMEIISYVLDGVLEHKDSMGNGSQMRPGEVQLMSAGSGVTHSEFNGSSKDPLHFLQMWVFPREEGTAPRYQQREFAEQERRGRLRLVVSPDGADGSLTIDQDTRLHVGTFGSGEATRFELGADRAGWLHVARGRLRLNGEELDAGDGAALAADDAPFVLEMAGADGDDAAEVVLWDLPKSWPE